MVQEWSLGSMAKIGADVAVESKLEFWPCSIQLSTLCIDNIPLTDIFV